MKKRGFLLVECIIYLGLCGMILLLISPLIIPYIRELRLQQESTKIYKYLVGTDIYISSRVNEAKVNEIYCNNNEIYIRLENNEMQIDVVKLNGTNLVVEYYKYNNRVGVNTLLRDVEKFEVKDKDNLVYTTIKQLNNKERVFCYEKK